MPAICFVTCLIPRQAILVLLPEERNTMSAFILPCWVSFEQFLLRASSYCPDCVHVLNPHKPQGWGGYLKLRANCVTEKVTLTNDAF